MLFKTHMLFSFIVALFTYEYFNLNPILFTIIVLVSSFIVDIDSTRSKAGKKLWMLSYPINFLFRHRGLFHSLLLWIVVVFLISLVSKYWIAVLIGVLSHLILDSLTKQGINFFYPLTFKVKGFIKTGGILEWIVFVLIVVGVVFVVI